MKVFHRLLLAFALCLGTTVAGAADEKLKPLILAYKTGGEVQAVADEVSQKLQSAGFVIAGAYSPYANARVIAITSDELKQHAAKSEFGGYGAAQRVSVTKVGGEIQVAYTNPVYMANAYRMAGNLKGVAAKLEKALGKQEAFGAEGLSTEDLQEYHYTIGMEYFDEPTELNDFKSYNEAVKTVEANLAKGTAGVTKVYRIDIPGKQETVFGVAMKKPGESDKYMDDAYIMSIIDFKPLRSTAHLPYEIVVSGDKAYSLYARFRIAINFPDLSMMGENSFLKIMDSPEAIKNALIKVAGGKVNENFWE